MDHRPRTRRRRRIFGIGARDRALNDDQYPFELAFPVILVSGFLLAVVPYFLGPAPPMTDFCQHALVAHITNHYGDSQFNYQTYFTRDFSYRTMRLAQLLLSLLERSGGAILGARLFLVLFVAALYAGTYAYLRALAVNDAKWIALATLPFAFSWPVYSGLLPYVMTFPIFAFLLAWWASRPVSVARTVVGSIILLSLHGVHLLGAVAGALAIIAWSLADTVRKQRSVRDLGMDLLTVVPVTALILAIYASSPSGGKLLYSVPLAHIKGYIGFNCGSLAEPVVYINLAGLVGLGWVLLQLGRRRRLDPSLALAALALAVIGFVAPTDMVKLWPAGPRLLPYAILTSLGLLHLDRRSVIYFVVGVMSVLACDGIATITKIQSLGRSYRDFLSGLEHVPLGSKLLPILVDPHAGARGVDPFWSLASYYTIARGGAHPYVYAFPAYENQASPLIYRNRDDFPYDFLYRPAARPEEYRGVSAAYDIVLLWGQAPAIAGALGDEMDLLFENGDLRLYRPRRPREIHGRVGAFGAASPAAGAVPGSAER